MKRIVQGIQEFPSPKEHVGASPLNLPRGITELKTPKPRTITGPSTTEALMPPLTPLSIQNSPSPTRALMSPLTPPPTKNSPPSRSYTPTPAISLRQPPTLIKQTNLDGPPPQVPRTTHPPDLQRELDDPGDLHDRTTATRQQAIYHLWQVMTEASTQLRLARSMAIRVPPPHETVVTLTLRRAKLHLAREIDREALFLFTKGLKTADLKPAWAATLAGQRVLLTPKRQKREVTLPQHSSIA